MSATIPLIALSAADAPPDGDRVVLRSPAVGILRGVPTAGHLLGPGEVFARLTIIDRVHPLLVPEGVSGVVAVLHVDGFGSDTIPVEYAQPILTLAPISAASGLEIGAREGRRAAGAAIGEAIPAGCHAVLSPADGVLYRRPRPAEPPYVEPGSSVHAGQTLALIEAMKCFSAIAYGGPGFPDPAEIVEIRASDASEVRHGQILFVVK